MDNAGREQIRLLLVDLIDRAKSDLASLKEALFQDHAAKGRLRSGATIKRGQREIEQRASDLVAEAVHQVKLVDTSPEAFAMIAEAIERFKLVLASEFDEVIKAAEGRTDPAEGENSARRAAVELFSQGDVRLTRQLELHRFSFTSLSRSPLVGLRAASRPPASAPAPGPAARYEKGGRPPADFWDDLWSHIAVELYAGRLFPRSQADIERAMAGWIEGEGRSAAPSTIRARARRLWDRLAAEGNG